MRATVTPMPIIDIQIDVTSMFVPNVPPWFLNSLRTIEPGTAAARQPRAPVIPNRISLPQGNRSPVDESDGEVEFVGVRGGVATAGCGVALGAGLGGASFASVRVRLTLAAHFGHLISDSNQSGIENACLHCGQLY